MLVFSRNPLSELQDLSEDRQAELSAFTVDGRPFVVDSVYLNQVDIVDIENDKTITLIHNIMCRITEDCGVIAIGIALNSVKFGFVGKAKVYRMNYES